MDLSKVSLNIYSFGYSAGFIKSSRVNSFPDLKVTLDHVLEISQNYGLGGIEFPFDFFFRSSLEEGLSFIEKCYSRNLNVFLDFENFDVAFLSSVIPQLKKFNISKIRVKMDHLTPVFYGGNRYREPRFFRSIENFQMEIQKLLPTLKENNVQILIENHQDLSSHDLVSLCERFGADWVGINWDIGNSLATGETVEQFFEHAKNFIGNVHIKDYQIALTSEGFKMVRCAIGEGDISIEQWIKRASDLNISMSIELGAQISREAHVFCKEYFEAYNCDKKKQEGFIDFIQKVSSQGKEAKTLYENNPEDYQRIIKNEKQEVLNSIEFLKGL